MKCAVITTVIGVIVILSSVSLGIMTAWLFPRVIMNKRRRFDGSLRQAVRTQLARVQAAT